MDENPAPEYWRALDRKAEVIIPINSDFLHACLLFISFICHWHCLDLKRAKCKTFTHVVGKYYIPQADSVCFNVADYAGRLE
jgi:hypothetical protein